MSESDALDLGSTYVVVGPDHSAVPVQVTPDIFEELDRRFEGFKARMLVASFSFESDWPTWEIHPAGDEIVCLLSGDVTMVLQRVAGEEHVRLRQPGSFVIVPAQTWHTARTSTRTTMLFLTPGEGTRNKPV